MSPFWRLRCLLLGDGLWCRSHAGALDRRVQGAHEGGTLNRMSSKVGLVSTTKWLVSISLSFCPCHCCRGCLMISLPFSADNLLPPWSIDLWKDGTKPRHHAMIVLIVTVHGSYHVSRRQRFHRA